MAPRIRTSSWLLGTTLRRSRAQWRLQAVVLAVAVLASTLITSLGLLVAATEQGGVHGALTSIPTSQSTINLQVVHQFVPIAEGRAKVEKAVATVLGDAGTFTSSGVALSELATVPGVEDIAKEPGLVYFGEFDGLTDHAKLISGKWAADATATTPGAVAVTLPQATVKALGYKLGTTFVIKNDPANVTAEVVGVYTAVNPTSTYWNKDVLHGKGNDSQFPLPNVNFFSPTNAFGPLIAAPGAIDAAKIRVLSLDVTFRPDFSRATVDQLAPLVSRLAKANVSIPQQVGNIANTFFYTSDLAEASKGAATSLVVTRSTVVVVSLLLLVLAVVAMGQTARLFTDARAGERQLLRSRGASGAHILALGSLEALIIGVITAVASPPLATLVYRLLAVQPAMRAAKMPLDAGLPPLIWLVSAAISLVFVIVLIVPLLRRARSFVEGEQSKGRQRSATGIMRSGLDIAFVALAAIAYWQLQSYRSPVDANASLAVDPVLVAGPALVLLAAALLCARLIPAASKIVERIGTRSRGSIVPLAAWEIGRRSQRATSAVLLLSLALAVGSFGLSFLETWKQSQIDQADLAVGPPVRVPVNGATVGGQAAVLSVGAIGTPQPVIRRVGQVGSADGNRSVANSPTGIDSIVLGIPADARALISRGRLAHEGGAIVRDSLRGLSDSATGIELAGDARGVAATVQINGLETAGVPGVAAAVSAIVEDANGLITTVSLGEVDVDGQPHPVSGLIQQPKQNLEIARPLRLVGIQASLIVGNAREYGLGNPETHANLLVKDLAVLHLDAAKNSDPTTYVSTPTSVTPGLRWFGKNANASDFPPSTPDPPAGWQLDLGFVIPQEVLTHPSTFTLVGWNPVAVMPAVIPAAFAIELNVKQGEFLVIQLNGVSVNIQVAGIAPLIPGTADAASLTSSSSGFAANASQAEVVAVDQTLLSRSLAQLGVEGAMVDEWWVDVPSAHGSAYLASLKNAPDARSGEALGLQLQQAPLRVATQAALWLAILAGAVLAAIGFGVHSTTTLRSRRLELAQLRAIGLSRNKLVALFSVESLLLCVLGTVFGIAIGLTLVVLVGPLVAVSPDGTPTVPSVTIEIPWASIGLLVVEIAAILALVVAAVARVQRTVEPAELLRGGSEP